jgi:hypothetical protein
MPIWRPEHSKAEAGPTPFDRRDLDAADIGVASARSFA